MKKKCQCNNTGNLSPGFESMYEPEKELPFVNHEPGKCKCTNELKEYKRGGEKVWLCSYCNMFNDVLVEEDIKK